MEYVVTKKFGKYNIGQTVSDEDYYIRRKLEEGGCLEAKSITAYENKMIDPKKNKMEGK